MQKVLDHGGAELVGPTAVSSWSFEGGPPWSGHALWESEFRIAGEMSPAVGVGIGFGPLSRRGAGRGRNCVRRLG